jgi:hypothetical protein
VVRAAKADVPTTRAGRLGASAAALLALVAALAPMPRWTIERWYSNGLFPLLQHALTPASNLIPFALFDPLWIGALAGTATWSYRRCHQRPLSRSLRRMIFEGGTAAAALYLVFLFTWGMNYRRVPLLTRVDFDASRITREAAGELGTRVAAQLNAFYADAHRQPISLPALAAAFASAQRSLGAEWTIVPARPKQTLLGAYFHQTAIAGMTDPFLLETMIAPDLLDVEKPFVIAHEWAHLAGYADESEANFVGWLACQHGGAPAQYSAALMMIGYVQPPNRPLREALAIGPRTDLYAIQERYAHTSRALQFAARQGYDAYLKANRVQAGVVSYDLVVQLVLGTAFNENGNPVMR